MTHLKFNNYIGGKEVLLSGQTFTVESSIYPDYQFLAPEAGLFDIKTAISKARTSVKDCHALTFSERIEILERAAASFSPTATDFEFAVKTTGMPISNVRSFSEDIRNIYRNVPIAIEKHIGRLGDRFGHDLRHSEGTVHFEPINGIVYAITPGNDIRVTAFIASWLVALGIPGIFKCSKNDLAFANKTLQKLVEAGYPEGGLNLLCWDTQKKENAKLNFELVDSSKVVWAYGADSTVDFMLRFETKSENQVLDHFSDKTILRHATGRTAAISSPKTDIEKVSERATTSALTWPIGCNSLKALFNASNKNTEVVSALTEKFEQLAKHTGDPMKNTTKIGFTEPKLLAQVWNRINDLKKTGQLSLLTGEKISERQCTPLLLETLDLNSEFLNTEFSTYLLTIKNCSGFSEAIDEVNVTSGANRRLVVTVFSSENEKLGRIHAHRINMNTITTDLDLLFQEGNDYFSKLTTPQLHK
jgi:acyl-CoA reductase-like NAD-dependent aldehyde dehydrogenase